MVLEILNLDDGWLAMVGGVGDLNGTLPCKDDRLIITCLEHWHSRQAYRVASSVSSWSVKNAVFIFIYI